MSNLGIKGITAAMTNLNPDAVFSYNEDYGFITGSIPVAKIVLPEGYYYSDKNGITNKHRTENGLYESYDYKYNSPQRKKRVWHFGRK